MAWSWGTRCWLGGGVLFVAFYSRAFLISEALCVGLQGVSAPQPIAAFSRPLHPRGPSSQVRHTNALPTLPSRPPRRPMTSKQGPESPVESCPRTAGTQQAKSQEGRQATRSPCASNPHHPLQPYSKPKMAHHAH